MIFALLLTTSTAFVSCRENKNDDVEDAVDDVGDGIEDAADDVGDALN